MGDEDAKVPDGNETQAEIPPTEPSTEAAADDEGDQEWGWNAEIPDDADEDQPDDEPAADTNESETNNSQPKNDDTPEEAEPATSIQGSPPPGFSSWKEVLDLATKAKAEPSPRVETPSAQRRTLPSLPFDDDPVVKRIVGQLTAATPQERLDAVKALPGEVGARVVQRLDALGDAHTKLRNDPHGFIREITDAVTRDVLEGSVFAERFTRLENEFYARTGQEFLTQHKITSAEQAELLKLAKVMPRDEALKVLNERRELRELRAMKQGLDTKGRQIEANQAASRAQQGAKGAGRKPAIDWKKEFKAAGTDALKLAKVAERKARAEGK